MNRGVDCRRSGVSGQNMLVNKYLQRWSHSKDSLIGKWWKSWLVTTALMLIGCRNKDYSNRTPLGYIRPLDRQRNSRSHELDEFCQQTDLLPATDAILFRIIKGIFLTPKASVVRWTAACPSFFGEPYFTSKMATTSTCSYHYNGALKCIDYQLIAAFL